MCVPAVGGRGCRSALPRIADPAVDALGLIAVADGAVVLTATRHLAHLLVEAYDAAQVAAGRTAWPTPTILPLQTWLARTWRETWPAQHLLGEAQAIAAWETVIRSDEAMRGPELLSTSAAARLAYEASELASAFRLPEDAGLDTTEEYEAFRRWRRRFRAACRGRAWLDPSELTDRVIVAVTQGAISVPNRILLAGFDELAPSTRELLEALSHAGSTVELWRPASAGSPPPTLVVAEDERDEIRLVADWARRVWRPGRQLGVIVPDLARRRAAIERILTAELSPASLAPPFAPSSAFAMGLGTPLDDEPVVYVAMTLLALLSGHVPFASVSLLLHTPFVGEGRAEHHRRGRLDAWLRRRREAHLTSAQAIRGADVAAAPQLAARLRAAEKQRRTLPSQSLPSAWADHFGALLDLMGWPGERTPDTREAQAIHAWHDTLATLASLDGHIGPCDLGAALERLTRLCRERVFQPRSTGAALRVVGVLDAASLRFDETWILGMHADALPRPARPHPLLPPALQRRHGLPHASPDHELSFAQRLFARLLETAPQVTVSVPAHLDEGGEPTRVSPLLAGLVPRRTQAADSHALRTLTHGVRAEEWTADLAPVASKVDRRRTMTSATLRDQSSCAFRAFAVHRLGAELLPHPADELTAAEHGTLVHVALELLWGALGDSSTLVALEPETRAGHLEWAAERALQRCRRRLIGRQREAERRRLIDLLDRWLTVEGSRPAFRVVAREHATEVVLGDVTLRLRIDRIDRLADGRHVVLDYKTRPASSGDWWSPRPRDPQLLAYAQVRDALLPDVDALAFGIVRARAYGFRGLASADDLVPDLPTPANDRTARAHGIADWPALRRSWSTTITRLAGEFADGLATIDPLPSACTLCHLAALCRRHERDRATAWESA